MAAERASLHFEDRVRAEDLLYSELYHSRDRGLLGKTFTVAVILHVAFLFLRFPDIKDAVIPQKAQNVIVVRKYVPPPPKIERQQVVRKQLTKKVPIPDPTPDEPEPIREPEPEIYDEPPPLPPDAEYVIGVPEAPPPSGPVLAGVGDVSNPVLIEETKVQPEYPELARVARIEGNVILQAVIETDGSVAEVEVLRCNRPNMGFEDTAIAAVKQWQYKPALQNGKPVAVYFTVFVEFKLH